MTPPSAGRLFAALDATWPAANYSTAGGFIIREGRGGGQRVSAATRADEDIDIDAAARAMSLLDQPPLFMLRPGEDTLDTELSARGYAVVDPVVAMVAPCARIATEPPAPLAAIECDLPLAILRQTWAAGGIGPGRINVMGRVRGPHTMLFARVGDRPGGCAFVACDGDVAMLHALWVLPDARRHGAARKILAKSAVWATTYGARDLAVVTTRANTQAQALFATCGMETVSSYHYRKLNPEAR